MKRSMLLSFVAMFLLSCSCLLGADVPQFGGSTPLQWATKMADSQMARKGEGMKYVEGGRKKWDYADNVFLMSLLGLGADIKDAKYQKFVDSIIGTFIEADGTIKTYKLDDYTLDNINPGKTVLALYKLNQDDGYKLALVNMHNQFETHPRTASGGFWHKKVYPNQMWLDGLFMAGPFRAEYAKVFDEPDAYDDIAKQFVLMGEHSYDPKTGLFYHGWDESKTQDWADKQTGHSPNFWSRAIGWYGMGLVDTLDYFPENHPGRAQLIDYLSKLVAGVEKSQDASGLWWQVTDQGNREGNYLEATGSAMFAYTIAKAVNKGYIPREHLATATKAFGAIVDKLIKTDADGKVTLTKCCSVAGLSAGRNGSFEYYIHEPIVDNDMKGVGPFIMAGIELQKALETKTAN